MPPHPLTPIAIPSSAFLAALHRYPSLVPAPLRDLDHARYTTIPAALASRRRDSPSSFSLTAAELVTLVEWKLKHGTFRPTLLALVRQNSADSVETATATAFAELEEDVPKALKTLTGLRGVGPATASLLLSCAEPAMVPFFGDEVFRWVFWEDEEVKGKGKGWGRKIGYTEKEYRELVGRVKAVVERVKGWGVEEELGIGEALAVEKVAWVLGKEGVDCGKGLVEGGGEEVKVEGKGTKREADNEGQAETKKVKKEREEKSGDVGQRETLTKRGKTQVQKAAAEDAPRRQTRSSTRKKA